MSQLHQDVLDLIKRKILSEPFTTKQVKDKLSNKWKPTTLSTFFSKHRVGNKGKYTEYYIKVKRGYKINRNGR